MFPDRQVIRQARPDGRGSWLKVEGPERSGTEHCEGPPTKTSNSPAPGPKNLLQEEVLGAEADHCQCMSGKVIKDAC